MTGQIKIESNRAGQTGSDNLQQAAAGPAPLVIGIGNDLRGDDGVGLWIARRLKAANLPGVRIEIQTGEAATLIESWQTTDSVILIDAVYADAHPSPGKIYRIAAHYRKLRGTR